MDREDADAAKNEENQDANRAEKERSRANNAAVDRLKFIIKNDSPPLVNHLSFKCLRQ